jgi:hypothetical protein
MGTWMSLRTTLSMRKMIDGGCLRQFEDNGLNWYPNFKSTIVCEQARFGGDSK